MFDATNTCRTCMKTNDNFINLFDPWIKDENTNFRFADALVEVTMTQVAREDGLPQCLCESCAKALEMSYTFRNQALRVDQELRRLFLLESNVKTELEELKTEDGDYADSAIDFDYIKAEEDVEKVEQENEEIGETVKDIFECYVCSKQYKSQKVYLKHIDSHTVILQCSECNKRFRRQKSLDLHMTLAHTHIQGFIAECNDIYENTEVKEEVEADVESNKEKFVCKTCDLAFDKRGSLASHMKKHTRNITYKCNECEAVFKSKPMLRRHLKLHTKVRPHECLQCSKSYSRADQLKVHMKKHSGTKGNTCPYCNKGFSQVCNLRDHIRIHTGETPYLCSECGKGFNNSSNLRQHMLRHAGVKPFSCKLCPKTFTTKGQMMAHQDTHTDAHPHKCEQCGASFTKPQSLKKHSLIHSGVRPYKCDVCPKRFLVQDHLTRHQRIHTGEKPYRCQFCSRAFTQSNDMTKHLRQHVGLNVYQCSVCEQRFRTQNELKKHYPSHYVNGVPPKLKQEHGNQSTASPTILPTTEVNHTEPNLPNLREILIGNNKTTHGTDRGGRVTRNKISTAELIDKTVGRICGGKTGTVQRVEGGGRIEGHKVNGTDHRITITLNPHAGKETGLAGSITINMDPGPS